MGGIENFFKTLSESWKKQVIFFCASMIVVCSCYFASMEVLDRNFEVIEDDYSWAYQVDSIVEEKDELIIIGWAFEIGKNAKEKMYEIILRDVETGKYVYPKMIYDYRKDVNQYFLCEYDYSASGFNAVIALDKLDLENKTYEIMLKPRGRRKVYSTETYYAEGKMLFVHPDKFTALDVVGTDLEPVIDKGVLRVYRPDCGTYVYQYGKNLYWIVEDGSGLTNEKYVVQYQMNTTQTQNLPEERLENGYLWGNLNFYFSNNELLDWNTGKYRVTMSSIPAEYSVTNIWTGYHTDEWIWKENFRPWYDFN